MPRAARIRDVAQEAGVSVTTVSLVLNGKDDAISAETRDRVRRAARTLRYRPNALAKSLRRQVTHTIAFISDEIVTTPYAGAMIQAAQDVAAESGYVLLLANTSYRADLEQQAIEALLDRQIDGAVYATMFHRVIEIPQALRAVPHVLLDARSDDLSVSSIVPDEVGGARAAVELLVDAGHRRIGLINDVQHPIAAFDRADAYRTVLREHGLAGGPELEVEGMSTTSGGVAAAEELFSRPDRPTALFCFNDRMAAGAYSVARRLGLNVPNDLSIVGFDNLELIADALDPGLTTVQLPHYEMGAWALRHLVEMLRGSGGGPVQERASCPIVLRGSVAAATTV